MCEEMWSDAAFEEIELMADMYEDLREWEDAQFEDVDESIFQE